MTNENNLRANSLADLISKLRQMFESNSVDIDQVKALMASYKSNPAEWIQYTHCDKNRYTRNGVDIGNGKYNLMIVCWPQNIISQIHDHSDSHCIMKVKFFIFCMFSFLHFNHSNRFLLVHCAKFDIVGRRLDKKIKKIMGL